MWLTYYALLSARPRSSLNVDRILRTRMRHTDPWVSYYCVCFFFGVKSEIPLTFGKNGTI